jgi:hypothetical protein
MRIGNNEKVWSHATIENIRDKQDDKGKAIRPLGATINKYMEKLEKETLKMLAVKKSMKIRLRVNMDVSEG